MPRQSLIIYFFFLLIVFSSKSFSQLNLEWAQYYHSSSLTTNDEQAVSLCLDDQLNIHVAGAAGTAKILKYDRNGNLSWDLYSSGVPNRIIFNGIGNFYISTNTGLYKLTNSGTLSIIGGGNTIDVIKGNDNFIYSSTNENHSVVIYKFNLNGNLIWFRTKQGSGPSSYWPTGMFQGVDNKINILGRYSYSTSFGTWGGTIFLTYDTLGNSLFDGDYPLGSILAAGDNFSNKNFFTGYRDYSTWHSDLLLYKLNSNNTAEDTIVFNGDGNGRDEPFAIETDNNGSIYVACRSWGVSVNYDFVVLKFNVNGDLIWQYRYNGSENSYDAAKKIKIGNDGNIYASGTVTLNSHGIQIYTVKLSPSGNLLWSDKFSRYNSNIDSNYVNDLQLDRYNNIYVCGKSRNSTTNKFDFVTIKYSDPTVIKNQNVNVEDFRILQNYPNPFNPDTYLKFILSKNTNVKINIFNTSGKMLLQLANSEFTQGEHTLIWNAASFPSGVYFISYETDNIKQIKKAILTK